MAQTLQFITQASIHAQKPNVTPAISSKVTQSHSTNIRCPSLPHFPIHPFGISNFDLLIH
jgi:hypothetical protein